MMAGTHLPCMVQTKILNMCLCARAEFSENDYNVFYPIIEQINFFNVDSGLFVAVKSHVDVVETSFRYFNKASGFGMSFLT